LAEKYDVPTATNGHPGTSTLIGKRAGLKHR
jgi:hypothetical protein